MTSHPYGWVITRNHLSNDHTPILRPRGMDPAIVLRLARREGKQFRLRDGDGGLDYEGRIIVAPEDDDGELLFAPLDWAKHDTGSASIEYLNEATGEWEEL